MSHDPHAAHGAVHASHEGAHGGRALPVSAGTTFGVKLMIIGGLVFSIMQGAFTVGSSGFGRVWPAEDVVKIPLPPSHF